MKIKMIMIAALLGFFSLSAHADFDQFGTTPATSINQYDMTDVWTAWSGWGIADLIAETTDNRTFTLKPNINAYVDDPATYADTNAVDGTMKFDQLLFFERTLKAADGPCTLGFNVSSNDLDSRYLLKATFQVIDPVNDYQPDPSFTVTSLPITTNGTYSFTSENILGREDKILQVGFSLYGINAAPSNEWGSTTIEVTDIDVPCLDTNPPTPAEPGFFSRDKYGDTSIILVATNAVDSMSGVEYYFTNLTARIGSGWISSQTWIDDGPSAGIITQDVLVVNHDFTTGVSDWTFAGGGGAIGGWTNLSGNGAAYLTVPAGAWAVFHQTITFVGTSFKGGDVVTVKADCQALDGLDNGGIRLKMECYDSDMLLIDGQSDASMAGPELFIDGNGQVSRSVVLLTGTENIKVVPVVNETSDWSSYSFDNITARGAVNITLGLAPETEYTYYVKYRDDSDNHNTTGWSITPISVWTGPADTNPPLPATMYFTATDVTPSTIKLKTVTAFDPAPASPIQYYFACTAGPGNDSGWIATNVYYDTGLASGTDYSYTVMARDVSFAKNSNTVSAATNITTMVAFGSTGFTNSLGQFTGDTTDQDTLLQLEKVGLITGSVNSSAIVEFDGFGATFGEGLGYQANNVLKTVATGYGDVSFIAYATLTFTGSTNDLSGFIGLGQGLLTGVSDNWGVPELSLAGVNGVLGQLKDINAGDSNNVACTLFKFVSGDSTGLGTNLSTAVIGSYEVVRARLTYDSVAETVNISLDKDYAGGAFAVDQDMGTVSTSVTDTNAAVTYSMWDGAPVSVYVGGGEGTVVKDFEIVVTRGFQVPFVVVPVIAGGEAVFTWTGVIGHTYDVLYKTNLVTDATWMTNESISVTEDGVISATSTVSEASTFYRVLSR